VDKNGKGYAALIQNKQDNSFRMVCFIFKIYYLFKHNYLKQSKLKIGKLENLDESGHEFEILPIRSVKELDEKHRNKRSIDDYLGSSGLSHAIFKRDLKDFNMPIDYIEIENGIIERYFY
jgi:hypothetical protein